MRSRFSCRPSKAPGDLDERDQHCNSGNDEIAQDNNFVSHVADEYPAHSHISVNRGIRNERKLPAGQAPGERRATGEKEGRKPYSVAFLLEYAREHCPKQNVGRDVQIRTEEMRF